MIFLFIFFVGGNNLRMKKFIVFAVILAAVCCTPLLKLAKNPIFSFSQVEKVCFVKSEKVNLDGFETVYCGDLVFNYCSFSTAQKNLEILKNDIKSVEFYLKNAKIDEILKKLDAQTISEQTIDGLCVICAYTPYYQDCIFLDGKKVNLQISCVDDQIIAGFPAILTGF